MKSISARSLLSSLMGALLMFTISCGPAANNSNVTTTNSANGDNANMSTSLADDPCAAGLDPDAKITKLTTKLTEKFDDDATLKKQFRGEGGAAPNFKFSFLKGGAEFGTPIYLVIDGQVSGKGTMEKLVHRVDNFVAKGCIQTVSFAPMTAAPSPAPSPAAGSSSLSSSRGFGWTACEYPLILCPPGECVGQCLVPTGNTNSNVPLKANTNTNSTVNAKPAANSNAKANTNSNTNSNSPPANK